MSYRARGRSLRWILVLCAALSGLGLLLTACSSGSATSGTTSSGTSSSGTSSAGTVASSLAAFQRALQADYTGHFTAPPTSAPAHKSGVNLWIISCGQASQGCAEPVANAKEAAQALGWKATVFDGNFGIGDAYNTGIRQAIADHAQAIIAIGVDCSQAKAGYQAAKAAGIIVVGANSFDCNDPQVNDGPSLFTATVKYTPQFPTAAATQYEVGVAKADWIIVHTNGHAQVIDTNFAGLTGGKYINQGFVAEMAKCTTCKIVKTISFSPQDTSNGTLKTEFASALAQYPQANAAINISDGIIIQDGFAQAIQSVGRTKTLALVGTEGFAPNVALIRNQDGQAAATPFDSVWVAWGAVDTVIRMLDHQPAVFEGAGVQVIDATHNLPAPGLSYSAPVNYVALYKKAWGV
jgi:ribose transport system substrate-binding protein